MGPFKPFGEEKYAMSYYEVPAEVLENKDEMAIWAQRAWEAAEKSRKAKKRTSKKKGTSRAKKKGR